MAKRRIGKKRGFSILSKTSVKGGRVAKKSRRKDDEMLHSVSISNSDSYDQGHEDHSNSDAEADQEEEMVVHREPSIYDNLVMALGSGSRSVANASKMSQSVEEGKSDSDEDRGNDLGSASVSEENEDGITDSSEDDGAEGAEMDGEGELATNGQSIAIASANTSSFEDHLKYKLSKEEADSLLNMNWKYKWQVSTIDLSNCKWMTTSEFLPEDTNMKSYYGLKPSLYDHWLETYKASGGHDFHSSKQRSFFSLCNSYRDVLHHNRKPFYLKGKEDDSSIMDAYVMHSLNHVFRTIELVTKNDKKLAKREVTAEMELLNSDIFLDHGFTRPKILILLPLASFAFRVVKRMIQLTPSGNKVNVEHFGRFSVDFGSEGSDDQDDEDRVDNSKSQKTVKPSDFQSLFSGNNNDHFMIGIKFTKRSIKLYSDFYTSDIIVASPLGLITKIGESEAEKEKDVDYLSSIEVLIVDHADIITMQNWSHVNMVVEHLNKIPSKQHKTDIMRIRQWYLDGLAKFYRQTIILGSYVNPDINGLFSKRCHNYRGKVKLFCDHRGVLPKVLLQVRQIYERFDAESILDADNARLEYFCTKVFPKIKDSLQGGVMIFISSYFEFVRVRNFLRRQEASVCLLGEYTKQSDISRARVWFFQGKRKIMLYTERAHFYHRYKIRGIQNLIIYSLPERKEFYPEIVNMLEGDTMICTVLFSRFDLLRLERIVGTTAAKRMVTSEKRVFTFC